MIVFESEVLEPSRAFVVITLAILQGQRCRRDRGSHSLLSSNHPGGLQILLAFAYPLGAETGGEAQSQQVQGLPSSPVTPQTRPDPCHVLDMLSYLEHPARDGHQSSDRSQRQEEVKDGGSDVLPHPRHRRESRVLENFRIEGHPRQSPGTAPTCKTRATSRGDDALSAPPRPTEGRFGVTVYKNAEVQSRG